MPRRMQVMMVCHQFPPETFGGAEVHTEQLARHLAAAHNVSVFAACAHHPGIGSRPRRDAVSGLEVLRVPPAACQTLEGTYRDTQVEAQFAHYLDERPADVVHFHHVGRLSTRLPGIAADRGARTVATLHDYWYICPRINLLLPDGSCCDGPEEGEACTRQACFQAAWPPPAVAGTGLSGRLARSLTAALPDGLRTRLGKVVSRRRRSAPAESVTAAQSRDRFRTFQAMLHNVDRVLSPSRFLARKVEQCGLASERITLMPYGTDTARLQRVERRRPPGVIRFGFAGRIAPHKGLHVAREALDRLPADRVELHVWGDGPAEYRDRVRHLAPSNVIFHGVYGRDRIAEAFATFDVLVVPSVWYENAPLVIHEAFATGAPVIISDLGAMPEHVTHEVNGLLFAPGSADALAEQMRRLIETPTLVERLANGIEPLVTTEEVAERVGSVYEELAGGGAVGER